MTLMQTLDPAQLESVGIYYPARIYRNLSTAQLYEEVIRRGEGRMAHGGAVAVLAGKHTGRSPNDKYIVREPSSDKHVAWGTFNQPISEANFETLRKRMLAYLQRRDVFVQDCFVGADPRYRLPLRVITDTAWQSLFAHSLFLRPTPDQLQSFAPGFTLIAAIGFRTAPEIDGTASDTAIVMHFGQRLLLIAYSAYGGEIKKSVFTLMNYLLPLQGVLSMHCSANVGKKGDSALLFGLSGTGKTSLSADPQRPLIGDDEHGWTDQGIFNFEGGCYAKIIRLSPKAEPQIYGAIHRFGALLENVVMNEETRELLLDDGSITENTRAAYPLTYIENAMPTGLAGHPKNIIMLTADAFGVMPPIARLTPEQAMYHFLSGYTAKVAGTERGLGNEPQATFSTCFGAPFMVLHPTAYAKLLGEKISRHRVKCWLVNTGWNGGPFGVGRRIKIGYTRKMVQAALDGALDAVPTHTDPVFGIEVPTACPGVPSELLLPRQTWQDPEAYDRQAAELAKRFSDNFGAFAAFVSPEVRAAGPVGRR